MRARVCVCVPFPEGLPRAQRPPLPPPRPLKILSLSAQALEMAQWLQGKPSTVARNVDFGFMAAPLLI